MSKRPLKPDSLPPPKRTRSDETPPSEEKKGSTASVDTFEKKEVRRGTGRVALSADEIRSLRLASLILPKPIESDFVVVADGVHAQVTDSGKAIAYLDEFTNLDIHQVYDLEALLPEDWRMHLSGEFEKPYWLKLKEFLFAKDRAGRFMYPPVSQIFAAFEHCPSLQAVRVVVVGQDPYHSPGQAHGLAFSVPIGVPIPSSLQNIFTELLSDLGKDRFKHPDHGSLAGWAKQGVLLLNTALTVTYQKPGSHSQSGWHDFTSATIRLINEKAPQPVVFLAWGQHAQGRLQQIQERHLVLTAAHPSGLSADKGFFGCRHFSAANAFLLSQNLTTIDWAKTD